MIRCWYNYQCENLFFLFLDRNKSSLFQALLQNLKVTPSSKEKNTRNFLSSSFFSRLPCLKRKKNRYLKKNRPNNISFIKYNLKLVENLGRVKFVHVFHSG